MNITVATGRKSRKMKRRLRREIQLWEKSDCGLLGVHRPDGRIQMNKTHITVCKILNTKNTETQADKIIHVINHIRTCRKQISAKLRNADIFAFSKY